jgi:hypothetical protein
MKTIYLSFVFSLFIYAVLAQDKITIRKSKDTIDYFNIQMKYKYSLYKVTVNGFNQKFVCPKLLTIHGVAAIPDRYYANNWFKGYDSIISYGWYKRTNTNYLEGPVRSIFKEGTTYGNFKLNRKTNSLIMSIPNKNKKIKPVTYKLKVLKFSAYEVIFQDLEYKNGHKFYYFVRNYKWPFLY